MRSVYRTRGHGADCRLLFYADEPEAIFTAAARAVAHSGVPSQRLRMRETGEPIDVSLSAGDLASLLVDWINELIGRSEIAGAPYLCTRLRLETSDGGVACRATVAPVATRWRSYLKAATLHDLRFEKRGARWFAQVVCDL